jgi:hypothetical protein
MLTLARLADFVIVSAAVALLVWAIAAMWDLVDDVMERRGKR